MTQYPPIPPEPLAPSPADSLPGRAQPRMWALIATAGSGSRAGGSVPKQYRTVAGRPLVWHTLAAFAAVSRIERTLVLLAPGDAGFAALAPQATASQEGVPCGSTTRAGTVGNGLAALRARGAQDHDWVLVHDAARCLVTATLIDRLIDACVDDPVGGLLALPASDTVKRGADGRVAATVDRRVHWLAQTPQMFRLAMLQDAMRLAGDGVTDESSAIEASGRSPLLVPGDASNFKVTHPIDFAMAQAVLLSRRKTHGEELLYDYP